MRDTPNRPCVEVYLQVKPIPPECWPAWVVREAGATLITVDPSSTRAEVAMWSPDNLTVDEMNACRWAYRQPLVGMPLGEWWLEDECYPLDVPDALKLMPVDAEVDVGPTQHGCRIQLRARLEHAAAVWMADPRARSDIRKGA